MATTVGQHPVSAFTTPQNGDPLNADVVRSNDNAVRGAYVDHDADPGIHVQSSDLASRPAAGVAGRKWLTTDTGAVRLYYDTGATWVEADYMLEVPTANITVNGVIVGRGAGGAASSTALGINALDSETSGIGNTAIGQNTLTDVTTGNYNTAVGFDAFPGTAASVSNTAIGVEAMNLGSGSQNTCIGYRAMLASDGNNNTGAGASSLQSNSTGSNNTALGHSAGYGTGTNSNTTGANNTFIGYQAVGASATASNVITLGNSSIATLRCQVTTITSLSDARDKKDIVDVPAGLDFVKALQPRSFAWNMRDGGKVDVPEFGFVAQELQQAQVETGVTVPGLVYDENPEKLEASAGVLIPILVQAIKQLEARVAALEAAS